MMANRRCLNSLSRHCQYVFSSNPSLQTLRTLPHLHTLFPSEPLSLENPTSNTHQIRRAFKTLSRVHLESIRSFSSGRRGSGKSDDDDQDEYDEDGEVDEDDEDDEEDEDGEVGESSDGDGEGNDVPVSNCVVGRYYSLEEKEREAAAIGYKVIGPLNPSERPFKPWEPVFAVVQIGSHQFKVSNGDCIFTERLKFCEVNDKLVLNRVLMLGSKTQTIIGRPTLPDAAVHAVVEEHALDAKVIIFKKKRRKNYRRTKGHRQELTKLRITDIQGIQKPEKSKLEEPEKEEIAA